MDLPRRNRAETQGSPVSNRVDASNTELRKSWTIDDIRREEVMAAELLEIHRAMLSGYDVFPVFLGIRLCVAGQWGRVVGMNHKRCAMYFDGAQGQSSISWDDVMRLFDVKVKSEAVSTGVPAAYEFPSESPLQYKPADESLVALIRASFQGLVPEAADFHWLPGTRICVKGEWGTVVSISKSRCIVQLDGRKNRSPFLWESILKEQKKLREIGFHDPI